MNRDLPAEEWADNGHKAYSMKDFRAAEQAFAKATEAYSRDGDALFAAEMANNRSVALIRVGEAQAALDVVSGTEEVFSQAGDILHLAMAIGNQATALEALGRLEEAEESYQRCAELLKQIGETELRASVMQSLSTLQLRRGRQLEAIATMHAGIEGIKNPNLKQRLVKKLLQTPFKLLNRG